MKLENYYYKSKINNVQLENSSLNIRKIIFINDIRLTKINQ